MNFKNFSTSDHFVWLTDEYIYVIYYSPSTFDEEDDWDNELLESAEKIQKTIKLSIEKELIKKPDNEIKIPDNLTAQNLEKQL